MISGAAAEARPAAAPLEPRAINFGVTLNDVAAEAGKLAAQQTAPRQTGFAPAQPSLPPPGIPGIPSLQQSWQMAQNGGPPGFSPFYRPGEFPLGATPYGAVPGQQQTFTFERGLSLPAAVNNTGSRSEWAGYGLDQSGIGPAASAQGTLAAQGATKPGQLSNGPLGQPMMGSLQHLGATAGQGAAQVAYGGQAGNVAAFQGMPMLPSLAQQLPMNMGFLPNPGYQVQGLLGQGLSSVLPPPQFGAAGYPPAFGYGALGADPTLYAAAPTTGYHSMQPTQPVADHGSNPNGKRRDDESDDDDNAAGSPDDSYHQGGATFIGQDGRKSYSCMHPGCGKTYGSRGHLNRHRRVHQTETWYTCPIPGCDKKFARIDNMKVCFTFYSEGGRRQRQRRWVLFWLATGEWDC